MADTLDCRRKGQVNRMRVVAAIFLVVAFASVAGAATDQKEESRITLDVRDARVSEALRLLFEKSGQSFVVTGDVQGTVTAHVVDQPLKVALRAILSPLHLMYRRTDDVYVIVKELQPPRNYYSPQPTPPSPTREDEKEPESLVTEKISLNFVDGHELVSTLKGEPRMWDAVTDHGKLGLLPTPNEPGILVFRRPQRQDVPSRSLIPEDVDVGGSRLLIPNELRPLW